MFGDSVSHFLFVRSQFCFVACRPDFGRDGSGFSALLEEVVEPRLAHGKMLDNIFDGISFIVELKNAFS